MNYYKQILLIIFMALFSMNSVEAANWISTKNPTKPIVFLDTKSIYKFNNGAVYAIRYFNNKNDEVVATIYTDLESKVGIISVTPYKELNRYNYNIPNNINMKIINSNSSIYNSLEEVKNIILNKKVKYCRPQKCSYINKTNNDKSNIPRPTINSVPSPKFSYEETKNTNKISTTNNKNVDFGPYMNELQLSIKKNWNPPSGDKSKRVILLFSIARNGELLNVKVYKSSGSLRADNAAIEAVKATAPFKPLPIDFNDNSVDIQFSFDYNVFSN